MKPVDVQDMASDDLMVPEKSILESLLDKPDTKHQEQRQKVYQKQELQDLSSVNQSNFEQPVSVGNLFNLKKVLTIYIYFHFSY